MPEMVVVVFSAIIKVIIRIKKDYSQIIIKIKIMATIIRIKTTTITGFFVTIIAKTTITTIIMEESFLVTIIIKVAKVIRISKLCNRYLTCI